MTSVWLKNRDVTLQTTMKYTGTYKPGLIKSIECLVYHYTAVNALTAKRVLTQRGDVMCGECGGDGRLPNGRICRMCKGNGEFTNTARSAHFLIKRDGTVIQMAALDERTWHAGGRTSRYKGRGNVNGRSIGIEIENYGPLDKHEDGHLRTWVGQNIYAERKPVLIEGQWWDSYTPDQYDAVEELTKELLRVFPQIKNKDQLVGHSDVDPTRKIDPGPAFDWNRVHALL